MAANIENTRTGDREVPGRRYGRLTAEFTAAGVILREKGSSKRFGPVPWSTIYEVGMKMEARAASTNGR